MPVLRVLTPLGVVMRPEKRPVSHSHLGLKTSIDGEECMPHEGLREVDQLREEEEEESTVSICTKSIKVPNASVMEKNHVLNVS